MSTHSERLTRAAKYLQAVPLYADRWAYWDDASRSYWEVTADTLEELCDYLDDASLCPDAYAYSLWCSEAPADEIARASPYVREYAGHSLRRCYETLQQCNWLQPVSAPALQELTRAQVSQLVDEHLERSAVLLRMIDLRSAV